MSEILSAQWAALEAREVSHRSHKDACHCPCPFPISRRQRLANGQLMMHVAPLGSWSLAVARLAAVLA